MKKFLTKVVSAVLCTAMTLTVLPTIHANAEEQNKTKSQLYAEALGSGINLGNTFDAFDRVNHSEIDDETAWGNPIVTQAYMDDIKAKGYDSIRIPFTAFTRTDSDYKITKTYLDRYETAVNYALNSGLYVMVNLHHDSSEWLNAWGGDVNAEEYKRFCALWRQLADRFKDYNDKVMFESINEVYFIDGDENSQNQRVKKLSEAFYDIVRNSGGNNATRMLVFPTTSTNHNLVYSDFLADYLKGLNDENVLATVHYYSTELYAYTVNCGVSMFDETYNGSTARQTVDKFYDCLKEAFVDNGIGVIVGEYGLFNMGYKNALEDGEVVKFIDYMNYRARELGGINLMLWECGNIIDRNTFEYTNKIWGNAFSACMKERCSYATGLDELFVSDSNINNDIEIPLTLNGNTFEGIYNGDQQLVENVDYTYADKTVVLKGTYIAGLPKESYGQIADLSFKFSAGADWHELINYTGNTPALEDISADVRSDDGYMSYYDTDGTATYPVVIIPSDFQGKKVRRITSYDSNNNVKHANSWASIYLQDGGEFIANYRDGELLLMNWYNDAITDDTYKLVIEFYDGTSVNYSLTKQGSHFTGSQL